MNQYTVWEVCLVSMPTILFVVGALLPQIGAKHASVSYVLS